MKTIKTITKISGIIITSFFLLQFAIFAQETTLPEQASCAHDIAEKLYAEGKHDEALNQDIKYIIALASNIASCKNPVAAIDIMKLWIERDDPYAVDQLTEQLLNSGINQNQLPDIADLLAEYDYLQEATDIDMHFLEQNPLMIYSHAMRWEKRKHPEIGMMIIEYFKAHKPDLIKPKFKSEL